jgi:phage I-like protein
VTQVAEKEPKSGPPEGGPSEERLVIGSASLEGDQAPRSVLIAPWGEVRSASGTFVVDEEGAELVIAAFAAQGTDIPIDYEHQSLGGTYASPSGQAPAAGWIRGLRAVRPEEAGDGEAGLFADVEWTAPGREKLAAREYRYLSPVVLVRKSDRRVVALHSAALTNKPAIVGMKPIVNRAGIVTEGTGREEASATQTNAREASGAREDRGVEARTVSAGEAVEVLQLRLRLPSGCGVEEVLVAAERRLAELEREATEAEANRKVSAAAAAGKLTAGQRDWAFQLALKDPASFEAWAATAPPVVPLGRTEGPARVACGGRDRAAVTAAARASYQADETLKLLTSEQAWIAEALREAGIEGE